MSRFRVAFVALAVAWALLVPAAPFAASLPASASPPAAGAVLAVVYGIGRLICHQRPERSFYLFGHQLPVCARCTGVYAGAALTAVATVFLNRRRLGPNLGIPTRGAARRVLLMAIAPIVASILYEWSTGEMPGHWTRAVTGVPLGAAVAWIVCVVAQEPLAGQWRTGSGKTTESS